MQTKSPDRADLVTALVRERAFLVKNKIPTTDVRLCVTETGAWWLNYGDVCYDSEHTAFCGASSISASDSHVEILALADELITQIEDQISECES